ncbi:MAG: hypothetical protein FD147_1468 [Chloroflexi bacterium]|nr:MAG: hypothetical protein FD147_1468 [Chloroflexota bacterium]
MDIPGLSILILGPPVIQLNGKTLKINRREQRAILFYLAGHIEPASRSDICDVFWPDDEETAARKKLREGLSRLRSCLMDSTVIQTENDFLSLDPSRVYVDAREYNAIVQPILSSSEMTSPGKLPDWLYTQLRKAMSLCRGNQFLQSVSLPESNGFENWLAFSNQSYTFSREKIIERLADHCIAAGKIDEAILWLGIAINYDALNTDINYLMLNCLKERGRIKEALDHLRYLDSLYRVNQPEGLPQILQDVQKRLEESRRDQKKSYPDEWPGFEPDAVPFVGRHDLISRLNHALHRRGIVHVTGESGSGKTRLVQEFYSRLDFKPRLLFCIGKPMITSSPFSPLIDGLRSQVKPEEWISLPEHITEELAILFPELRSEDLKLDSISKEFASLEPLQSLFNALYYLLTKLAEKKPLLFVISIAQWCDDATIEFLSYLNEHTFFKKNGLLVLISRQEETNQALEIYLDRSMLANSLEKIQLETFTVEETTQLVTTVLGRNLSDDLIKKIQSDTGGNPFFLIETLRAIKNLDFDIKSFSKEDLYPIPPTIKAIVREKTRQLSENAKEALKAAAVLGKQFLPEVLESMIETGSEDFVSALEELQRASILAGESGLQTISHYAFLHDQIREVILQDLSPARKRNLHMLAVKALQSVKGDLPELASVYACHYERAGEITKAFESWCAAGRFSRSRFSRDDTYAAYQHALDLLPSVPSQYTELLVHQLYVEWADYAYDLSDYTTCEKIYRICLEIGENRQSPLLIGSGLSGLGRVAGMRNNQGEGIEQINKALFFLSKANAKGEELEAYARLGILHNYNNDYINAEKSFRYGLQIGKNYEDKRSLDAAVNIQTHLSLLNTMMGWPAQAEVIAAQAVNDSQLIVRRSAKVQATSVLALAQLSGAKYKKSIQSALSIYELAVQLKMRWWISLLDLILARNYLALGHLDMSWIHAKQAIERENKHPLRKLVSHGHSVFGNIFRLLGDLKSAEDYYRLGVKQPVNDFQTLENLYLLGLTLCQNNHFDEGISLLEESIRTSEKLGLASISLPARMAKLMSTAEKLREDDFQRQAEDVVKEMQDRGFGSSWMIADAINGGLAVKMGNKELAKQLYTKVADFGRSIDNRWFELQAYSGLLSVYDKNDNERKIIKERVQKIMDEMAEHATQKPVFGLFNKFRKEWEKR